MSVKTGMELGMKESYRERLASDSGRDPYAGDGNIVGASSASGNVGQVLSSEIKLTRVPILSRLREGNTGGAVKRQGTRRTRRSRRPCACVDIPYAGTERSYRLPLGSGMSPRTGTGSKRHRRERRHAR